MNGERSVARLALEFTLVVVGSTCLGWYAGTQAAIARIRAIDRLVLSHELAAAQQPAPAPVDMPELRVLGELEIPRLQLFALVERGESSDVLQAAAGYLTDTALPWETGNSVLAAHRDGLFRPLEHVAIGDEIKLSTLHGEFTYRVRRTLVVEPTDLSVLGSSPNVDLTLVTCYPFVYVGSAPKRFIVQAEKTSRR
jgi:sortase A